MKNKVTKKLLASLMTAAIVASTVGCGSQTPAATTEAPAAEEAKTETAEAPAEAAAEATEEAPVEEELNYDFGGRTFRIGSYYDMTPDPNSGALEAALADRIAEVEEKCNCKIEFVDLGGDYVADYVTSVLAGDPVVDVGYVITTTLLPSLIEGGIATPLSDLGVLDLSEYKWRADVVEAGKYKGKNYAMLLKDPEIRYGIFWNKSLFDQYGLPDLYELVDKGEWTWDKFQEIAQAGNQDLDGDGAIDIYGFNARENLAWCYLYSNGAYVAEKTDSGIKVDLSDNKVAESLTGLQNFAQNVEYRDAIDWSVEGWDSFIKDFRDGKYMMCLEEFWISYAYLNKEEDGMSDDWGWVPFPKGPSAKDWSCYGKENGARFILNGVEKPEEVAQVYDLITDLADTDEEWDDLMEDKLENWCDDAKTAELVSYIYNNKLAVINGVMGFSDLNGAINDMISEVTSGNMTPATALETYQSSIDAAIADLENVDYGAAMLEYQIEEEGEAESSGN
ncbi:MAG: extracellular solute-binding protein [Butyrivibrio sp.]|nr:extracellular solute-binding protein [Butyrivibrio sp.]